MSRHPAYSIEGHDRQSRIIVTCDHATNIVPPCTGGGDLGLPAAEMARHIAFDIGAEGVSSKLSRKLNAPMIASRFSRLVIDPNRAEDDPTLLMKLYDGTIIEGNRNADHTERERRLATFYRPYDMAIATAAAAVENPIFVAVHSFTKRLRGRPPRPWHIGILFAHDRRLSDPLISSLTQEGRFVIGKNEPYTGALGGDTMDRHALRHGHLHVLIEIRNDLIETPQAQEEWAEILATHLRYAIAEAEKDTPRGQTNTA